MENRYYSLNGKGKYYISKPDKNGMVNAIDATRKDSEPITIKKSLLRPWVNPVGTYKINPKRRR